MKRNLYLVQVNAAFENSMYLPYAAGALAACVLADDSLRQAYTLHEILYRRTDPDAVVRGLASPSVMAFSNYIWNWEYNKILAAKVKAAFPQCRIVFGGHNIPGGTRTLETLPFVDVLVFGEGERTFCALLRQLAAGGALSAVPNLAYRDGGACVCTPTEICTDVDFPSPYAAGVFDSIVSSADVRFSAILETNRGCPYGCAFCDWGLLRTKIRAFPMERVLGDLTWMAEHRIEYCYCADSNFGILKRDTDIIEHAIRIKKQYGYPQKFRVNYLKNSDDVVFEINRRLLENDMSRGVTLSFQSLCPKTLEIIGRRNIPIPQFRQLLARYQRAGIAAYSELILGLPGETYESFCDGLELLLEAGQHSSVFIYNCELLVNSRMGQADFKREYALETVHIPFNQDHFEPAADPIPEYSNIIVSTSTMDRDSWVRTAAMSVSVQALHCLGLLQCIAIYLFERTKLPYMAFYARFLAALERDDGVCAQAYRDAIGTVRGFAAGQNAWSIVDPRFGRISWPVEEGIFLRLVAHCSDFYAFVSAFLEREFPGVVPPALVRFQRFLLKKPVEPQRSERFSCDWLAYFESIWRGVPEPLCAGTVVYTKQSAPYPDLHTYAKEAVWFGRRSGKLLDTALTVTKET